MTLDFYKSLNKKSSDVSLYDISVLRKDQRTHPKRNEQSETTTLVTITIFNYLIGAHNVHINSPLVGISTHPFNIFLNIKNMVIDRDSCITVSIVN